MASILRSSTLRATARPTSTSSLLSCQRYQLPANSRSVSSTSSNQQAVAAAVPSSASTESPPPQSRKASTHAVSNPTLANIENRWELMPPKEQAELWIALKDRMSADWKDLTWQEKKASYWIAFGPHGPRAEPPPGENWKIAGLTVAGLGISLVVFLAIHHGAQEPPMTMTKEWQEATNEFMRENKIEPITGVSSEGYQGKGMVQSK